MEWIDLVLAQSEGDLREQVQSLSLEDRELLKTSMLSLLEIEPAELEVSVFRILIERLRPFALPQELWSRGLNETTSVRDMAGRHLEHFGLATSDPRLRQMQDLYRRYCEERQRFGVTEARLTTCNYRCSHCGLLFYNEELEDLGIVSPFGNRGAAKLDPLKPHWHDVNRRKPRVDHNWPIALFGSNDEANLRILCDGCNTGKADFSTLEHTREFVGHHQGKKLRGERPVSWAMFYAQVLYRGVCARTGCTAREAELTVVLKNQRLPAVLDNLVTVESAE